MPRVVTIMVVEDHPATLAAITKVLQKALPACALLATGSAERALHLCASAAPHLVIMDIALPGISGIEATRRIKALWPDTHVVMHSGYDVRVYRDASAAAGASAFVLKGKVLSELLPVVCSLLPPAAATRNRDFPTA